VKKLNKKFKIFRVIILACNHHFIILKLFLVIKVFILYQIKQTALKSGHNFTTYANSQTPAELKNCKLEYPSPLFKPLDS